MKEINIIVPYFHDCQERSIFWFFVLFLTILPQTSQPHNPRFLLGKKGPVQNGLAYSPEVKYIIKLYSKENVFQISLCPYFKIRYKTGHCSI